MKKQNFFLIVALLFACNTIFAQTQDGFQIYLKPWYPGTPPIIGIAPPKDSIPHNIPFSLNEVKIISCYKNSSHLTLQCNNDERVDVVIYEMLSGVKYTSTMNMVAGEIYTIATPWGTGLYTIRLTLSDGTILEGDFQIK
ncbi:MAG: hypothetical protein IJY67_07160 [Paludibacteraceae bacterium]|nr:hypothetical protein [Paludibacteraceae bacterium]